MTRRSSTTYAWLRFPVAAVLATFVAATFLTASSAIGAPAPPCPSGNLLETARLADTLDVQGPISSLVDGYGAAEGRTVSASRGIHFLSAGGSLTYDLGVSRPIAAAVVQGETTNGYSLQISDDGTTFREIWAVPMVANEGRGLRTRYMSFSEVSARYVRFGEPTGPGARSVSELELFCELPAAWPMPLTVAPPDPPAPPHPWTFARIVRVHAGTMHLILALLGAAVLAWGLIARRRGAPVRPSRFRDATLLLLGFLGLASYYNFGLLHFGNRIHLHEFFHYYIGSKYFPELGYSHLYECASLAEAEDGFRRRVELRTIRDLRQNELVSARYVLEDPERFKRGFSRPFTPARWEAFKKDVAYFRDRAGVATWENMLKDHGYNPTPVWNMTASILSNLGPASTPFLENVLAAFDPILVLAAFGFIAWAFGWRAACVGLIFFGTNEPAIFYWTGGAYLRQDWFAFAMIGVCLLKRGKPFLGGASLAYSTLLRVFPLGFFVGVGIRILWILARERRLDPTGMRIVAGAALATALLVPASSVVARSTAAWPEFVKNSKKHASSPLTNYMGLRTVVGFRWETRQRYTFNPNAADPFHDFREARKKAFRSPMGQPLFVVLVAAYLALLAWALRREPEWWVAAAFGFGVIAVGMELTCYYYSFLVAAAFLGEKRPAISVGLLLLSAVTYLLVRVTYYYDVRYYAESVVVVAFVVWATWYYGLRPAAERTALTEQASAPAPPAP